MKRLLASVLGSALVSMLPLQAATALECELGEPVSASIGDGVTLYSCSWEKSPGEFVRSGPLELVRNGILILKLQTDRDGKLQGEFSAWDDQGVLTESGYYVNGLKHGEWRLVDRNGERSVLQFRAGIPVAL